MSNFNLSIKETPSEMAICGISKIMGLKSTVRFFIDTNNLPKQLEWALQGLTS